MHVHACLRAHPAPARCTRRLPRERPTHTTHCTTHRAAHTQPGVGLAAEHGFFVKPPGVSRWHSRFPLADHSWQAMVLPILKQVRRARVMQRMRVCVTQLVSTAWPRRRHSLNPAHHSTPLHAMPCNATSRHHTHTHTHTPQYCECTDGSSIERKASALVWHYGDADPDFGNWQVRTLVRVCVGVWVCVRLGPLWHACRLSCFVSTPAAGVALPAGVTPPGDTCHRVTLQRSHRHESMSHHCHTNVTPMSHTCHTNATHMSHAMTGQGAAGPPGGRAVQQARGGHQRQHHRGGQATGACVLAGALACVCMCVCV
jgi:hypothetical protein